MEGTMSDGSTDEVTSFLKQKAGPLPVGVWIIAVGGGIGIALYMRRNAAASSAADVPTGDPTTDYTQGGNTSTPAGAGNLGASNVTPLPTAPADNDEWMQRAANYLVAKGVSGSLAQNVLSRFLGGDTLDNQDRAIVDIAIAAVGNPPTAPPPAANKPPVPPVVPPRQVPPMPKPNGPAKPAVPGPPVQPHLVSQAAGRSTIGVTSVRGATAYIWIVNGQQENTTSGPAVTLTQLTKGKSYVVSVIPQNVSGKGSQSKGLVFKQGK
jgi:hypothetical protein